MKEIITKAVAELTKKTKTSSFWTKWFWYLLAGGLGFILIASLAISAYFKSQKAAKALHERDVLLEKRQQEKADAIVTKAESKKRKHLEKAKKYTDSANEKLIKAQKLNKQAKSNRQIIDSLRGWDDVYKRVKF